MKGSSRVLTQPAARFGEIVPPAPCLPTPEPYRLKPAALAVGFITVILTGEMVSAATIDVPAQYPSIQGAIDAASAGDTIRVAPGEYLIVEPLTFRGKAITVIGEGGCDATTIRMADPPADPRRGSIVIFESGEGATSILEGLTLTGGTGTKWSEEGRRDGGGGILCLEGSSPTLKSLVILDNFAGDDGGGVACKNGCSPTLIACAIAGNSAQDDGGALWCQSSCSPTLTACVLSGNSVGWDGGAIFCEFESSPTLTDCTIIENTAGLNGGGLYVESSSAPSLTNCTIAGNDAVWDGGGVYCLTTSSPTFLRCTISGNQAKRGGGVCCLDTCSPTLKNCVIAGNAAVHAGGILCDGSNTPPLVNCTIAGNVGFGGGVYCMVRSSPELVNCIVWGNAGGAITAEKEASPQVTYSCTDGADVFPGLGNIAADPQFVRPGQWDDGGTPDAIADDVWLAGDYYLRPTSPAVDAGVSQGAPETDIAGTPRPCGAGVDMGAFEYCGTRFRRGDATADGMLNIADAVTTLLYIYRNGNAPICLDAADANDDGAVDLADAVYTLQFMFIEGPAIPVPYPACGIDPSRDDLPCESYPLCME